MSTIARPLWYNNYYEDVRDQLNLSNNVCYDKILQDKIKFDFNPSDLRQYPDASMLYYNLAEYYNVDPKQLAIGFGAGDIIYRLFSFLKDYSIGIYTPTYDLARIFAINLNLDVFTSDNLEEIYTDVLYIANPNGITGKAIDRDQLIELSKKYKFLIVDEAYGDFCNKNYSTIQDAVKVENIITIKTFSKSVAAAGLRFGYCFANEKFIYNFQNVRSSTVITGFHDLIVPFLLENIEPHVSRMIETRKHIEKNYDCEPSQGNFVLFKNKQKFNCKMKHMPTGFYRMALTDLDTFIQLKNHDFEP